MEKSSKNKVFKAIGCMSGTAMDGIDIALIETDGYEYIRPIGFISESHDSAFREKLRSCLNKTSRDSLTETIEKEFTLRHIPLIKKLMCNLNVSSQDIDIIGFHGQTIHHNPNEKITIQLGDGQLLSQEIGVPVSYDFRQADIQSGGQGAPLLPIYHKALSVNAGIDLPTAIVNIGGVGNITWIDYDGMIAFDTGPGNAMIDDWVKSQTDNLYDEGGKYAANGTIDKDIVKQFTSSDYFLKKYPKSLDRNDFHESSVDGMTLENGAATLTEMTIQSIALAISQCPTPPKSIYISGGGRHNSTIISRLSDAIGITVKPSDTLGWNGDSLEAEGFAYMAVRRVLNEPISFPTTTGCPSPMVGGIIAKPIHKIEAA